MGFDARAIASAVGLFAAGIVAALGWAKGLYATAMLAVVVALWIGAVVYSATRRRTAPPPPSPMSRTP